MLNFKSHVTAALCASGLIAAALGPSLQMPISSPTESAGSEMAIVELLPANEQDEFIGELPVSVVTSTFDLATTDSSQFGDLDLD